MSETMPILYVPAPILRARARLVEATDDVRALSEKMLATMYAAPGIGLAAPQVGEALRLVVLDVSAKDAPPNRSAYSWRFYSCAPTFRVGACSTSCYF